MKKLHNPSPSIAIIVGSRPKTDISCLRPYTHDQPHKKAMLPSSRQHYPSVVLSQTSHHTQKSHHTLKARKYDVRSRAYRKHFGRLAPLHIHLEYFHGGYILNHEQSFADDFNDFMREVSLAKGHIYHRFSLDGQDRDTAGDYLISDSMRFALVEFKYTSSEIVRENRKPRRRQLCRLLACSADMRRIHDTCHFISWTDRNSLTGLINVYRNEVCNRAVLGAESGIESNTASTDQRSPLHEFASAFFHSESASASLEEMESYLAWVMQQTSGSASSSVELIGRECGSRQFVQVRLESIVEAHAWMQRHRMPPHAPSYSSPAP